MALVESENEHNKEHEELIPGLPNEIAEICLLHVPYPYQPLVRSVSSSWNRAITNPSFLLSKKTKTLSHPHLFVLAFHTVTSKIQWQSLDPSSNRWFILPHMPLLNNDAVCPTSFASASLPRHEKIFFIGGTSTSTLVYRTAVNKWSTVPEMITGKSFFAAEEVKGKIVTVGESGTGIYDPESDTWKRGAKFTGELRRYETVVNGGKMFVTEGWWWPFAVRPRGWVYELESDTWSEMREGMKDGWTGVSVTMCGRVFMIPEVDLPVKVYDEITDTWRCVGGERLPRNGMKKPFIAKGFEDRIYVVWHGLKVVIGNVVVVDDVCGVKVTWHVLEGPEAFGELSPSSCQVVYA